MKITHHQIINFHESIFGSIVAALTDAHLTFSINVQATGTIWQAIDVAIWSALECHSIEMVKGKDDNSSTFDHLSWRLLHISKSIYANGDKWTTCVPSTPHVYEFTHQYLCQKNVKIPHPTIQDCYMLLFGK